MKTVVSVQSGVVGPVRSSVPKCGSSCGSSDVDSDLVLGREDSDSSDCTCDIEGSQEQDSGRFSADLIQPSPVSPIIAPPSPFVTRNTKPLQPQRHRDDKNALNDRGRDQPPSRELLRNIIVIGEEDSTALRKDHKETNQQTKRILPSKENGKESPKLTSDVNRGNGITNQSTAHAAAHVPICKTCAKIEKLLFNTDCQSCWSFFKMPDATPSHVFAILRLWIPEVQKNIENLVKMALLLGCGIQDRDAVTDMTLLHYAVKAGTHVIGQPLSALRVVSDLLKKGADPRQRCKWTSMTALHYAAFFDVPEVLELILRCPEGVPIDDPCLEYSNGTALHIAAANLSEGAFKVLLRHGASPWCRDSHGRTPQECLPSTDQFDLVPGLQEVIIRMQRFMLRQRVNGSSPCDISGDNFYGVSGKAILQTVGLKIGDRVLVSGTKTAILKYAGPTEFATGLWAGVELESPQGRHDGTVKGVVYFRCAKNYGLFVPINRLTKIPSLSSPEALSRDSRIRGVSKFRKRDGHPSPSQRRSLSLPPRRVNHGKVDVSKISSKVAQDIRNDERKIVMGDRVCVNMGVDATGVVRFTGAVHFASGFWIGVELDEAMGSNDGSVCGTRYFICRRQHGIFALSSRVTKLTDNHDEGWSHVTSLNRNRLAKNNSNNNNNNYHSSHYCSDLRDSFTSSSSSSSSPYLLEEEGVVPSGLPKLALYPTNTSMSNLNRCFSGRYISSRKRRDKIQRQKEEKAREPQWLEPPVVPDPVLARRAVLKELPPTLQIGQSVFYKNKFATVRYLGRVHFAEGTWLGLELKEKNGRNNGMVKGRRYFSCRSGHGVMIPPHKVTVHGVNGAQMVKTEDEEEEDLQSSYNVISIL